MKVFNKNELKVTPKKVNTGRVKTDSSRPITVVLRYWGGNFKNEFAAKLFDKEFKALVQRGWKCHFVLEFLPEDKDWIRDLQDMGVVFHCLPRPRGNFDLRSVRRIWKLCREIKPDIIQCENIHCPPLIAAALAGVPVRVWRKHSMSSQFEQNQVPSLKQRLEISTRLSCHLASRVVAVSSGVRDEVARLCPGVDRVQAISNPRPVRRSPAPDRRQARLDFGFTDNDVVLVAVGHAVPVKAWDILIQAFGEVVADDPRAKLLLAGSISSSVEREVYAELVRMIKAAGLQNQVAFTGHLLDIRPVLVAGDVYVMPSRSEGCSFALLEALDAGLPCVLSDVGNAKEMIEETGAGLLFQRNDLQGLCGALLEVVKDDALRQSLAKRSRIPDSIMTADMYAEYVARLYENLIGNCRSTLAQ